MLDMDIIRHEMDRRVPGKNEISTPRKEKDEFDIISGYFNKRTTGTPLCAIIWNTDRQSSDYDNVAKAPRPGHADYTGSIKFSGFNDYRGGGHFSGRLTAALVFAGAVSKQILCEKGIKILSHIYRIGNIEDSPFDKLDITEKIANSLFKSDFPVIDIQRGIQMKKLISDVKNEQDSVGGVVEAAILNLPAGLGEPFFDSVESKLSHLLFSIPAVKGVEFGEGFEISQMKGSEANDEFYINKGKIKTSTNHNGGILGGITNGMPVIFRAAFKPTPSIGRLQRTVDLDKMEDTQISIKGRHDPCIVHRALPVVEAAAAMAVLDLL
jgi:chorismate synthase